MKPKTEYVADGSKELWWCNVHGRKATHVLLKDGKPNGEHHCDPRKGGIMIPCRCVNLTGLAEIVET